MTVSLKPFRLYVKVKHFAGKEFQSSVMQGKKLLTYTSLRHLEWWQKNLASYWNIKWISHKNEEVEPVQLVQMNIYQKIPIVYLSWLHFDEESSFQDEQLVKEQQSYISVSLAYLTYPRSSQELQLINEHSISCLVV